MPRKSASSANVLSIASSNKWLRPPPNLPQAERDLFASLVAANPPSHFKLSDMPLLTQYCAAAILNDQAAQELRVAPVIGGLKPSPWLAVFEKTNRAVVALSMRLRLSPQARSPNHPPGARKEPRPSAYEIMRRAAADDETE
jgi:phage terminase small subunit